MMRQYCKQYCYGVNIDNAVTPGITPGDGQLGKVKGYADYESQTIIISLVLTCVVLSK